MMVTVSLMERERITHPFLGDTYVCVHAATLKAIEKVLQPTKKGLAGIVDDAMKSGIFPYGAGDNTFYVAVKEPHEGRVKGLSQINGDEDVIVAPVDKVEFKHLVEIFVFKYCQQMHS